jgi:hypothetical protein
MSSLLGLHYLQPLVQSFSPSHSPILWLENVAGYFEQHCSFAEASKGPFEKDRNVLHVFLPTVEVELGYDNKQEVRCSYSQPQGFDTLGVLAAVPLTFIPQAHKDAHLTKAEAVDFSKKCEEQMYGFEQNY